MDAGFGLGRLHHIWTRRMRETVVLGAIDAGFRHFDLAPAYGDGLTERELGRTLAARREQVHIATKFGIPFRAIGELPIPLYYSIRVAGKVLRTSFGAEYDRRDFSPQALVRSLEESLRRLQTDYIDLLLVHEPMSLDQFGLLGDTWAELERQRDRGRIRKFGVSGDTQMLLDTERKGLVPATAVRMVPMNDVTCGLDDAWFRAREVFVFNIVNYFLRQRGPGRIDTETLLDEFVQRLPTCRPILASHNLDEIKRMGAAIARLSNRVASVTVRP